MDIIAVLRADLGAGVVHGPDEADFPRHSRDFLNAAPDGVALIGVAYPRTTEQVSHILRACNAAGVAVQPQGGLTGLAGGGVPQAPCLVLSLERMRAILEIDADAGTMTVEAGVVLETVQKAADAAGLFFPLDLGGRGSAQIGGNAATNAGGNRVLRYGMMRDLVLGVEAVLADGTVLTSLNKMIKNNAGYDLKQLFIGSEGTLGIITRLVLRLFPKPQSVSTALLALDDYPAVLDLLRRARAGFGGTLSAFEVMWPDFYTLGTSALGRQPPVAEGHGIYVLIETMGTDPAADQVRFEEVLGAALEDGVAQDAVIAQSDAQTQALWAIRDCPGEFPKVFWPQISFDVSLPTGEIGLRVPELRARLERAFPGVRTVFFGHVADSNLHLSVHPVEDPMPVHAIDEVVYSAIGEWRGSISAEHGIGTIKRAFLHHSRTAQEIALMRLLKAALDPNGILNPGKVI
ncbi:MAG: D-2-hydroxyglutarate dehydrogenase [Sphingomonas bacterium]|nr:FAD-binding oxidoreductase [Sphingomonas bacterium]MDB5689466.1 D-2-hydroxyglutarate dehydrogenase [Sphingomonas bacterium]